MNPNPESELETNPDLLTAAKANLGKLQSQDQTSEPIPSNRNVSPPSVPGMDALVDIAVDSRAIAKAGCLVPVSASLPCADLAFPLPEVVEDFSRLNRSDLAELERHPHLIGYIERSYLGKVKRKPEIFPQRFHDPDYLANSAIMLLSTGWSSAHKYAHCCIRGQVNRAGACKLHKYCPYCSWFFGNKAQLTYVPAFDSGTWHWLTGSYSGDLLYDESAGAAANWLHYWDAYKLAFTQMVQDGLVRGIYWTEELAVNSFCPTRVLPHVHAVVDADDVDEAALRQVQESVNAHLATAVEGAHLQPDVDVEELGTQRRLMNRIGYMFKPLKLVRPYRNAWAGAVLHNRSGATQLNNAATDLVLGFSQVTQDRQKMHGRGTLDPKRRKSFIGMHEEQHAKHKRLLREVKAEAAAEYIEVREVDDELTFAE